MPIYEYSCRECGSEFEKLVASQVAVVSCPSCSGERVMRRISLVGVKTGGRTGSPTAMASGGGGCCGGGCGCH
jgi:putative FmdB family regulatory protein